MSQILAGFFLILHGLVHLLGFVVPWQFVKLAEMPYKVTLLSGKIDVGAGGIRFIGVLWFLATVGFVAAGGSLITAYPLWQGLTLAVSLFSLALCILGWPDSQFGVYINLAILVFLLLGERIGLLPMFKGGQNESNHLKIHHLHCALSTWRGTHDGNFSCAWFFTTASWHSRSWLLTDLLGESLSNALSILFGLP